MEAEDRNEEAIFAAAIEIESPQERAAFVKSACGQDAELLRRVEELLRVHFEDACFLTAPPGVSEVVPEMSPSAEGPGTVIGRYTLLELIGEGGFGRVYLAEQERPIRRRVALKIIKLGMDTEQVIARFEAERQALAMLDHPNIAHIFEAGSTEGGRPYFAMEYFKGLPITEYCDRHRLRIEERLGLFVQVCQAVQHAHQRGIIHRDIKPSNIVVDVQDGRAVPKIIDFGVAKAICLPLTEKTLFTRQGQLIGTPEYMSPEQADLREKDIDTRTDIYSLGVVLYELLAGALPFEPETLREAGYAEIQQVICKQDPPRPSTRLSTLGEHAPTVAENRQIELVTLIKCLHKELEWIPLMAIRKDRDQRYRTAADLANDITRYLNGDPLIAGPESGLYRFKKFIIKRWGLIAISSSVIIGLLCGILISVFMVLNQARKEKEAISLCTQVWAMINANSNESTNDVVLSKAEKLYQLKPKDFFVQGMLGLAQYRMGKESEALWSLKNSYVQSQKSYQNSYLYYDTDLRRKSLFYLAPSDLVSFNEEIAAHLVELLLKQDNKDVDGKDIRVRLEHGAISDVDIAGLTVGNLNALKGLQIKILNLSEATIEDIAPLKDLPLSYLNLSHTNISDISALENLPLHYLNLEGTQVKDLTPLIAMPLKHLILPDDQMDPLDIITSLDLKCVAYTPTSKPVFLMDLHSAFLLDNDMSITCKELSGNYPDGTLHGPQLAINSEEGLYFDGEDDYLSLPEGSLSNISDLTLTAWIKPQSTETYPRMVIYSEGLDKLRFYIDGETGFGNYYVLNGNSLKGASVSKNFIKYDAWNFFAITLEGGGKDTGNVVLYINGKEAGSGQGQIQGVFKDVATIGGINNGNALFKGFIREIATYYQTLSSKEIIALYYMGTRKLKLEDPFNSVTIKSASLYPVWKKMMLGELDESLKNADNLKLLPLPNNPPLETREVVDKLAERFYERGSTEEYNGDYVKAVADYKSVIHINPSHIPAIEKLIWIFLTRFESYDLALEYATKACNLTNWEDWKYLGTLAAVCSIIGDFENAIKWQQKAAELLPQSEHANLSSKYTFLLEKYISSKPYPANILGRPWCFSTKDIIAHWTFDEVQDQIVFDSTKNNFSGQIMGNAKIIEDTERGQVLGLEGDESYLYCNNLSTFDETDSFTVSVWVYWTGSNMWERIFDFGNTESTYMMLTPRSKRNTLLFAITTMGYTNEQRLETNQLSTGKWVHLAVTIGGNTGNLFVNGTLVDSNNGMRLSPLDIKATNKYFGKSQWPYDPYFQGRLDDVRIYSYALSVEEIYELYKEESVNPHN